MEINISPFDSSVQMEL